MVQNLPVHYDNPVFRDDMLRVISASVAKMNAMCSRLTLLTHRIELHPTEADLSELVHTALAELDGTWQGILHRELQPMLPVRMDTEQLRKVLNNLMLNALEAVEQDGEIRVATAQIDRWAVLTVHDNGCGMSQEFLTRFLFEPFHTTKS